MDQKLEFPEHEKMRAVLDDSQTIGEFLENLSHDGVCLARYDDDGERLVRVTDSIEKVLADYFDIDLSKIEAEKQAMLASLRAAHNASKAGAK